MAETSGTKPTKVELTASTGFPRSYTCASGVAIAKYSVLALSDPRTAAANAASCSVCAGIASMDKAANDESTRITVWTDGVFDMAASGAIEVGGKVMLAAGNDVMAADTTASGAAEIGYALEDASYCKGKIIMAFETHGAEELRNEVYDGIVKGYATQVYKFKQALTIDPTGAWTNYYYRESPDVLTEPPGNAIKGIPRGAEFPSASVSWEKHQGIIEKYGCEDNIAYEDLITDNIDVRNRTLFRIAERVAKSVDDEIWDSMTESRANDLSIQSFAIASDKEWDSSSAAVIDDLLHAKQLIAEQNYDTGNLMCFVSPKDFRSMMTYLSDNGNNFPSVGEGIARNGNMGTIAGVKIIQSNSVTASYALVCVPKKCGTWKQLMPLKTVTKEDALKSLTIRSAEFGTTQITDPKAIVLISNTQE